MRSSPPSPSAHLPCRSPGREGKPKLWNDYAELLAGNSHAKKLCRFLSCSVYGVEIVLQIFFMLPRPVKAEPCLCNRKQLASARRTARGGETTMSYNVKDILTGLDLLGFGIAPGEEPRAVRHPAKRTVTAKVGKPPARNKPTALEGVSLLGFEPKTGQASDADLDQLRRNVTAKVGKPPTFQTRQPR